jgi:hypothetical protein
MTLARIIGLVLAPTGVLVAGWAFAGFMQQSPAGGGWIAPGLAMGFGGAMIIVGARYILKPKSAPAAKTDGVGEGA